MRRTLTYIFVFLFAAASAIYASSTDSFYKKSTLDISSAREALDVAEIPVTYDLSSVKNSYIKMGFSKTDPSGHGQPTAFDANTIALKGDAESGKIVGFSSDVYAYCRIVSTVPVVIGITGLAPMTCGSDSRSTKNNVIDWQVYSEEDGVYFDGLKGKYIVPAKNFLEHKPMVAGAEEDGANKGTIESIKSVKLYIESESFRGKEIGNYSAELIMTITSIN